jgi:hypothetical protein
LPSHGPEIDFSGKTFGRLHGNQPSKSPNHNSSKENERNSRQAPFGLGIEAGCPDISAGFVEPPRQEVTFLDSLL